MDIEPVSTLLQTFCKPLNLCNVIGPRRLLDATGKYGRQRLLLLAEPIGRALAAPVRHSARKPHFGSSTTTTCCCSFLRSRTLPVCQLLSLFLEECRPGTHFGSSRADRPKQNQNKATLGPLAAPAKSAQRHLSASSSSETPPLIAP